MSDLPITSDEGATPVVINDPTTVANVAKVTAAGNLQVVDAVDTSISSGVGTASGQAGGIAGLYSTTQPAPTNGQQVEMQLDQAGNLLTFPGVQTKTGSVWSSATSGGTVQYPTGTTTVGAPLGCDVIVVQLDQTTTITAGAVTFQGTYDGTNWVTIPSSQVLNPETFAQQTDPYTFVASTNQVFWILLQGFQQIRLNLSTAITGTGTVTPYWTLIGNQSLVFSRPIPVGTQGNAWNAASVSSGGNSNVIDLQYNDVITIFGNVSGNVNPLRIQASQDNVNFYTVTTISATTGNFGTTLNWGARYMMLQSGQGGAAVTITATVAGK